VLLPGDPNRARLRGDRVAVPADTGEDFLKVFFGCQYAGLVPCPIPYSMYLGGKDAFDQAIADFSAAYADKNERDFARLENAAAAGQIAVERGF